MIEEIFADTSGLVALGNRYDYQHKQANEILRKLSPFRFVITNFVVAETLTRLRYTLRCHEGNVLLRHSAFIGSVDPAARRLECASEIPRFLPWERRAPARLLPDRMARLNLRS